MFRVSRTILFSGLLSLAAVIFADAQTPSGLPNTPPSGQVPDASAATTGGRANSGVSSGTTTTAPAASSTEAPKPPAAAEKSPSAETPAATGQPAGKESTNA